MPIIMGSDHGGFALKEELKRRLMEAGYEVLDDGCYDLQPVDYPDVAVKVAHHVLESEGSFGVLCCGTGIGISIAANKVDGIRCCHCSDCYSAKMSRAHNDANMLALGGRVIAPELAKMIVETFVKGEFEGGRHQTRIDMLKIIEQGGQLE